MELKNEENYYLKRKPKLLRKFDQLARAMHQVLASYYGEEEAAGIVHAVRCEYESLVPELPYIGGRKNSLSDSLEGTAASLVLYKVMKARGENTADIGRIHQEIIETHLYSLPRWRFWMVGKIVSTGTGQRIFKHILRKRASESQQRHYAADFVFNVVEGEEGDFNFQIEHHSYDEIGRMADSMREMIETQREKVEFAKSIAEGNLSVKPQVKSEKDILGKAFLARSIVFGL